MSPHRRLPRNALKTMAIALTIAAVVSWVYYRPRGASVPVTLETAPVRSDEDAADDAAIWVCPDDPEASLIIGTDKRRGLVVYDLEGRLLDTIDYTNQNNVDLRDDIPTPNGPITLVVSSATDLNRALLYRLDPAARRLRHDPVLALDLGVRPEGVCFYRSARDGSTYVFITGRRKTDREHGWAEQWRIDTSGEVFAGEQVRTFHVGSEVEGVCADDTLGNLFISEENVGVWRYRAEPDGGEERVLVDRLGWSGNLRYNCEGIAIYADRDDEGWILVSSQGSNDFTVYERRDPHRYVGRFSLASHDGVDGVSHTDGIDVTSRPVGARFPQGFLIAQDDRNPGANQNFKIVDWRDVKEALEPLIAKGD